jgi:hypothetical protein
VHRPLVRRSKVQDREDGARFDHRGEGLVEVDVGALGKSTNNPPCFAAFQ